MDRYSRTVAYLKVLLPLAALALLSTLFLLSRGSHTEAVIPFARQEIEDRMRGQQITNPLFTAITDQGDEVMLAATMARAGSGANAGPGAAIDLEAEVRMPGGRRMFLLSDTGTILPDRDEASFAGNVRITSADGMLVETDELNAALSGLRAESPGPVRATGPMGDLQAGRMRIAAKSEGGPLHLLFNNGVKLVYDPENPEN